MHVDMYVICQYLGHDDIYIVITDILNYQLNIY